MSTYSALNGTSSTWAMSIFPMLRQLWPSWCESFFLIWTCPYAQFTYANLSGISILIPSGRQFTICRNVAAKLTFLFTKYFAACSLFMFFLTFVIKVIGSTIDGASVCQWLVRLHTSSKEVLCKVPNPFSTHGRDLLFFSDPPHLIKTTKNC